MTETMPSLRHLAPVATRDALPSVASEGDCCWAEDEGCSYVRVGHEWLLLGSAVDTPKVTRTADVTRRLRAACDKTACELGQEWPGLPNFHRRQAEWFGSLRTELNVACARAELELHLRAGQRTAYLDALQREVDRARALLDVLDPALRLLGDAD